MKIYFASPQNTPYQREFAINCIRQLEDAGFSVYRGQNEFINNSSAFSISDTGKNKNESILQKSKPAAKVFLENFQKIKESDVLVALLDGSQVNDRVAAEIGLFYGLMLQDKSKKGIFGLVTDARCLRRRDSSYAVNIFTMGTLEEVGAAYENLEDLIAALKAISQKE